MDSPLFASQVSMQPCGMGVVPQCQIEDLTSKKPRTMHKTVLCRNFMAKGRCRYGENCIFAHSLGEKRSNQLQWQNSVTAGKKVRNWNVVENTYKRGTCRFIFSKGGCPYGKLCIFGHPELEKSEDERGMTWDSSVISIKTADSSSKTDPRSKAKLCHQWTMFSSCDYGAKCVYAHGQQELKGSSPSFASEYGSTWIPPRTWKNDALPYNVGGKSDQQKAPQNTCLLKWKRMRKIAGIYADWIDDESPLLCSVSEQE